MFAGREFANLPWPSSVPNLVDTFLGLEYAQPIPPHYTFIGPTLSREAEAQAVGNGANGKGGSKSSNDAAKLDNCPEILWLDELMLENARIHVIVINFGTTGVLKSAQFQTILKGFAQLHASATAPGMLGLLSSAFHCNSFIRPRFSRLIAAFGQ